jgi:tetratricopeptide (TPR) repeat protein
METENQYKLFEPFPQLRERVFKNLRAFDPRGALEELNRLRIVSPKDDFTVITIAAITLLLEKLDEITASGDDLGDAHALLHAWASFRSEAAKQPDIGPQVLSSLESGLRSRLIHMLEACTAEELSSAYPLLSLGHLKKESGDYLGAAAAFEELFPFRKEDVPLLIALANTYYQLGRFALSDQFYVRAFLEDTETVFREDVENKVLTFTLERFKGEDVDLCWFPVYAVLKRAVKLSPPLLQSFSGETGPGGSPLDGAYSFGEKDRARLFFLLMLKVEPTGPDSGQADRLALDRMSKIHPRVFTWYLDYAAGK